MAGSSRAEGKAVIQNASRRYRILDPHTSDVGVRMWDSITSLRNLESLGIASAGVSSSHLSANQALRFKILVGLGNVVPDPERPEAVACKRLLGGISRSMSRVAL